LPGLVNASSRSLLLAVALAFAGGSFVAAPDALAAKKTKKGDEIDEAQKLYEKASKSLTKGYYDDCINDFEKLRNTYPFSKYAVEAELKIADALFAKKEYADAADNYRTFAKLHPKHEQVDYATYHVGLSLFLEAPKSIDRDQSSTEKALEELRAFITQFPESKYADDAAKHIGQGRDRLAEKELYVGRWYAKHGEYKAALGRLRVVISRYPDTSAVEESTFLLGKSLFRTKQPDESKTTLSGFLEKYPSSEYAREARKILARLGSAAPKPKPVEKATPSTPTAVDTPAPSP
jgi:outer membrane protein assembly factor BamD